MGAVHDDPVKDVTELAFIIGAAVKDLARLLGLETQLALRTIVVMLVLSVFLALVLIAVWGSLAVAIAVGLYEYTILNVTGSVLAVCLLNVALGGAVAVTLRRMARRLSFPETRMALRALLSAGANAEEGGQ
ncbi:hypothetical protein [Aquisalimonas sp.]|uniref:hypothetical protein n=1 Tax=Aquisalimonas sp. TaxID=1872621 RepID=UPI0025BC8D38|nr:hypothetical protein [Aquisalimonas sp.]